MKTLPGQVNLIEHTRAAEGAFVAPLPTGLEQRPQPPARCPDNLVPTQPLPETRTTWREKLHPLLGCCGSLLLGIQRSNYKSAVVQPAATNVD